MEVKYESPNRSVWWPLYDLKSNKALSVSERIEISNNRVATH
jgi:hypothetical protein